MNILINYTFEKAKVKLIDMKGVILYEQDLLHNSNSINLASYPKGLNFSHVDIDGHETRKLICIN